MDQALDRREFLHRSLIGVGFAASPVFLARAARALARQDAAGPARNGGARSDRILVVLQLSGGNDGLSTVVPFANDDYRRARPTLGLAERDVLKVSDDIGLHGNLKKLKAAFDAGRLAVVQGVGYPNPNRSHFKSMDIWHAADPACRDHATGWLGRAADQAAKAAPGLDVNWVVNVGQSVPLALTGSAWRPVAFVEPQAYRWNGRKEEEEAYARTHEAGSGADRADERRTDAAPRS